MSTSSTKGSEGFTPVIGTVAGSGLAGLSKDGEPAVSAQLKNPFAVAVDGTGALYIADGGNHRVCKVTTDGKINTVAGNGTPGSKGDSSPATSAQLNLPRGVAVDSTGAVYIADAGNNRIRKITPDGKISTVAGTGAKGYAGDGGPATSARLHYPLAVAVDDADVVYIVDYGNSRVRKVATDGKISTVAGNGTPGFKGDGGLAVSAELRSPHAVAIDGIGALYIADAGNNRIRKITPDGKISTVAGTGAKGYAGDGGPADKAQLDTPVGVVVDSTGVLYISDYVNNRVRKVTPDGKISTVAGTGAKGYAGDGGPADTAPLNNQRGLAVDCVDTLHIADYGNHSVRKVTSERMAGLPESGTVVRWANVRSRLRMAVHRESLKDGAEIHQVLASARSHQRWRLIAAGQVDGEVLYRIENVRSGKVLEVADAQETAGAALVQRAYEGSEAHHQHWRLIPVGPAADTPRVFEIANHNSGLLLRVDTNARTEIRQHGSDGDHQSRQWQLLPV